MINPRYFSLILLVGLIGGGSAPSLFAQPNPDWATWRGVNRIHGVATVENESWKHDSGEPINEEWDQRRVTRYNFELGPKELQASSGVPAAFASKVRAQAKSICWISTDCRVNGFFAVNDHYDNSGRRGTITVNANYVRALQDTQGIQFIVYPDKGTWEFHTPVDLSDAYTVEYNRVAQTNDGGHWVDDSLHGTSQTSTAYDPVAFFSISLQGKAGFLSAYETRDFPIPNYPNHGGRRTMRVFLWPEFEDVDLEVTIDGYENWRPLGSLKDQQTAGSRLSVLATLKPRLGKPAITPKPIRYTFRLLDTSREPGVCMNWPLGATDHDPDLKLVADSAFPATVESEGQKLEIKSASTATTDQNGHFIARAQVHSYDFGARAKLYVTCELEDGRNIVGVMNAPTGDQTIIPLPNVLREGEWIAASWRKEKHVENLPDSDDSENDPKGDHHRGDGFTLYEEYRGFIENGKHIEGDPEKKDFFILNLIGADARPGIEIFELASELKVHSLLLSAEMSEELRLMNGNHSDGPHRVDQHGVWIKTFSHEDFLAFGGKGDGGYTKCSERGLVGRPGNTVGIGFLGRDDPEAVFNRPLNLKGADTLFLYDQAIAHELLHSIGVEHHGKGDYDITLQFLPPGHIANPTGAPQYAVEGDDGSYTIKKFLSESGHNVADDVYPKYLKVEQEVRAMFWDDFLVTSAAEVASKPPADWAALGYQTPPTALQRAEQKLKDSAAYSFTLKGSVGVQSGESSGDDSCIMRYPFSQMYESRNSADHVLYLSDPGTEPIGLSLCLSRVGTGVNDPNRNTPQPRYGNAALKRGNCAGQICPNDAIPAPPIPASTPAP